MNNKTLIIIVVFLIIGLVLGGYVGMKFQNWRNGRISFCTPDKLDATALFEGAAGNIYGVLGIKNISNGNCKINGKDFVQVNFDVTSYGNIGIIKTGLPSIDFYTLEPQQSLYVRVHMPNGPQCSSGIHMVPTTYSYQISSSEKVIFKDSQGKQNFSITACDAKTDFTNIDITNLSDQPVNQ